MIVAGSVLQQIASPYTGIVALSSVQSTMSLAADQRSTKFEALSSRPRHDLLPAATVAEGQCPLGRSRKRSTSIDPPETHQPALSKLTLNSPSKRHMDNGDEKDFICLCTPAPKVPRPRNAFILYRQHHQAQVVARHPGLANPEISKIIGEQWNLQPKDVKDSWKKLAEEEKIRHQLQYPDYRYQPRRGAKSGCPPSSAAGDEPGHCLKCGGRFIATPRTPSTPLMTPTAARANMLSHSQRDARMSEAEHNRHALPQSRPPYQYPQGNHQDSIGNEEARTPSPETKRRRYNTPTHYQTPSSPYPGHAHSRQLRTPVLRSGYGASSIPGPAQLERSGNGTMAPPPRPGHPTYLELRRGQGFDESLRLPPLQTQLVSSPHVREVELDHASAHPNGPNAHGSQEGRRRSVQELITDIPFMNKVNVLAKLCPLLAPSEGQSPGGRMRGAIIAVEGADESHMKQVSAGIQRVLLNTTKVELRTWSDELAETPKSFEDENGTIDGRSVDSSSTTSRKGSHGETAVGDMYVEYMQKIAQWHKKSHEIVKHVFSRLPAEADGIGQTRRSSDSQVDTPRPKTDAPASRLPVALLPQGFSLTIADRYACRIPIEDMYAPIDHWHWMVTLWRGVIGADLIIYVQTCDEDDILRSGAVEFRGNRTMVVKVAHDKGLEEKTKRRMCFEIVEWLRGGGFKEGLSRF